MPKSSKSDRYDTPLSAPEQAKYQQWAAKMGRDPVKESRNYDLQGAFKAGVKPAKNGHLPDTFKKPNHPTFSEESKYHGVDGNVGGRWTKQKTGPGWDYQASLTNLQHHSPATLKQYFKHVEPDSRINFTSGATVAPARRVKAK
jgi:hypothetical protein